MSGGQEDLVELSLDVLLVLLDHHSTHAAHDGDNVRRSWLASPPGRRHTVLLSFLARAACIKAQSLSPRPSLVLRAVGPKKNICWGGLAHRTPGIRRTLP